MCSPRTVKNATANAGESLVSNVTVRKKDGRVSGTRQSMDDFVADQKAKVSKIVDVEDRGQFQYKAGTSGDIVRTPEIESALKAKETTLNVQTTGSRLEDRGLTSYVVPAQLRIKRNWSVKGPGGVSIPSMNTDLPSQFARTDRPKANVRISGGRISYA